MLFVWVTLMVTAVTVWGLVYLAFFQPAWLVYTAPFKPLLAEVRPGDILPMEISRYNKTKDTRTLVTSRVLHCDSFKRPFHMQASPASVEPGYTVVNSWNLRIPTEFTDDDLSPPKPMPPGLCHMEGDSEVQGTIRPIVVHWRSGDFRIIRP